MTIEIGLEDVPVTVVPDNEAYWPYQKAALPTMEEVRYARELRLRLRERYESQPRLRARPWCIDVD